MNRIRTMMRLSLFLSLLVMFAAATTASAATVFNETVRNQSFSITSACTGETITGTFDAHTVIHVTQDGAGGFHLGIQQNLRGKGVGDLSGTKYVLNITFNDDFNVTNGALEQTVTAHLNLISQGSAPNEAIKELIHITFNANGEVTSVKFEFVDECRG